MAAAGWYSDPTTRAEVRYFDGTTWTEHVSTNGLQTVDAITGTAPPAAAATPTLLATLPAPVATQPVALLSPPASPIAGVSPGAERTVAPTTNAPGTIQPHPTTVPAPTQPIVAPASSDPPAASVYYPNCAAVRAAGAAPLHMGDPGYSTQLDGDGDGVDCE